MTHKEVNQITYKKWRISLRYKCEPPNFKVWKQTYNGWTQKIPNQCKIEDQIISKKVDSIKICMINNFFFPQPLGHNKESVEIKPRLTKLSFIGIPVLRVFQENNKIERYNFNKIKSERESICQQHYPRQQNFLAKKHIQQLTPPFTQKFSPFTSNPNPQFAKLPYSSQLHKRFYLHII